MPLVPKGILMGIVYVAPPDPVAFAEPSTVPTGLVLSIVWERKLPEHKKILTKR